MDSDTFRVERGQRKLVARIPLSLSLSFIHSWRGIGASPFVDGRDRSHHEIVRLNLVGFRRARLPAEGLTELSPSRSRGGRDACISSPRLAAHVLHSSLISLYKRGSLPDPPPVTDLKNRRLTLSRTTRVYDAGR